MPRDLVTLPGVVRVGIAPTEGGGRRLRFLAADAGDAGDKAGDDTVEWCHVDAYDDVPLMAVVRTGERGSDQDPDGTTSWFALEVG
ncbi:MAG: ATP-binding region ATPase domain protein [Nocardioides sp.]|nr:ATP-binding region ATPase domain protein [Nocardioides sp.]